MFERLKEFSEEHKRAKVERDAAMLNMLADLRYPVSQDGSVLDLTFFAPLIAWHLVRCGWRPDPERRRIKARKITAKGVVRDAVEWVDADEPDDPLAALPAMTVAEVAQMSPSVKAEALRRMGGPETTDLKPNPGWRVQTSLRIQSAPDTNDGRNWTGRKGVSK